MANENFKGTLDKYYQKYENDPEFVAEGLALKLTEEMLSALEEKKQNQSWLAEEMGVTRAHISRILNARPNMTLLTVAKIAIALGTKPDICLNSEANPIQWTFSLEQIRNTANMIGSDAYFNTAVHWGIGSILGGGAVYVTAGDVSGQYQCSQNKKETAYASTI